MGVLRMNDRIRGIVSHAYKSTQLYSELAEEGGIAVEDTEEFNIELLPVIGKDYIMRKEDNSLSSDYVVKAY